MKQKLLSTFIFLLTTFFCYAQYDIEWQRTIGGDFHDELDKIISTNDGGYILGGRSTSNISKDKTENCNGYDDYWIVKIDSLGSIMWQNTIGGSKYDRLTEAVQTTDGGFLIGGFSHSGISGDKNEDSLGYSDIWILKLDHVGNIIWQNTIGGKGTDVLQEIALTPDGGFLLGTYSDSDISDDKAENSINSSFDFWIIKIDSLGAIIWENTLGGSDNDYFTCMISTNDASFILAGTSYSDISGDKNQNSKGSDDFWIIKIDSLGNIIWQNTIGGNTNDRPYSITNSVGGGFVLAGWSNSNISSDKLENNIGGEDFWVVKIDSLGGIVWENTLGGNMGDAAYCVLQTSDGGYIIDGISTSNISVDKSENSKGIWDTWIIKLDSLGIIKWQKTIGGDNLDYSFSVVATNDGGYLFGGFTGSNTSGNIITNSNGYYDYWIAKLSPSSNLSGKVYADINQNNIQDSSEANISGIKITEANTGRYSFSQSDGSYFIGVFDTGSFVVSPAQINYYTPNPTTHTATFTAMQQIDSLNDFAYQPTTIANDLYISIHPLSPFRSGFNATYNIHYKNIGTTVLSPTIYFFNDAKVDFVSSNVLPDNIYADSVIWSLPALSPYGEGDITVTVYVHQGLQIGTLINSSAKIFPFVNDYDIANNNASWEVTTIGSFDPNEIIVNKDSVSIFDLKPVPPYLEYVIYFQNTGNDTAFNVKVENIIPKKLNLASFEYVSSSMPANISLNSESRLATFEFPNIQLPDSNVDEQGSHGYVRYRIKPNKTLQVGAEILSEASIYFDFNAPVITNKASTIIYSAFANIGTAISGTQTLCNDTNAVFNYKTTDNIGNTYSWNVIGGKIISGQGTSAINVKWLAAGTWQISLTECDTALQACDTSSFYVTVNPLYNVIASASICTGDSIYLANNWQTQSGIYNDTLQSTQGCDSVVQTALTINPAKTYTDTVNIVQGDSTFAGGMWQTQSGIYYDSLTTQFGCDSLVTTVLNVFTSINAITSQNNILTVRPNPAQNILEVTVNLPMFVSPQTFGTQTIAPQTLASKEIIFQLFDIHGKINLTATLTPNQKHLIDISTFENGIYIARAEYKGKRYEKKVIKN
nr:T9SS type A sorting domain-containing protein [Bacteroidota bacterium]